MSARLLRRQSLSTLATLVLLSAPIAHADDEARYEPSNGSGTHGASVGATVGFRSGLEPADRGGAAYSEGLYGVVFNGMLFQEPTVFGTLLGFEFDAMLGLRTFGDGLGSASEPAVSFTGAIDFAFAFDVLRWKVFSVRQRLILEGGGGLDYSALPLLALGLDSQWRGSPILGGHFQTSVGTVGMLDLRYRWLPLLSGPPGTSEHRAEVTLGFSSIQVGAHYVLTRIPGTGGNGQHRELGGSVRWAF